MLGEKRASQALEAQRFSQQHSESFQVSSNTKMLNIDTMERGQQLQCIKVVLPTSVIVAEAGTLRCFLVTFIMSGLAFLIGTRITDPFWHVSNQHQLHHVHRVCSKGVFFFTTSLVSLPEGKCYL